ncbi:MAG TPA: GTP-binding protein [Stellaceae bacterium]|nr:GTP-binding protein [Stellaceae bacterium]
MNRSTPTDRASDPAPAPTFDSIPVTLLTGFLGSGKTTLLRRALADPAFSDTAVIINEIGEIAIDHYLVDFVEGSVLELPGGCLCCAVREDLAQTLRSLIERRDAGDLKRFRRIVVETSGLADPAPILFTLGTDPLLDQRLRLARVVTLVDAVSGLSNLDRFAEATRQAAVADVLVISKTDLAAFGDDLAARLTTLNPNAERISGTDASDPAAVLFMPPRHARPATLPVADEAVSTAAPHAEHSHGIAAFSIVLHNAISRLDFALALGRLAQDRGNDLLRVKGLVRFADRPDRPAVVQAAQHAMFSPEWLDAWPDDDQRSRLVFIVHDIPTEEILDRFAFADPHLVGSVTPHAHASQ